MLGFLAWSIDQIGNWKLKRIWLPANRPKTQAAYDLIPMNCCCASYYFYCTIRTKNPKQLIRRILYFLSFFYAEKFTKEQGGNKTSRDVLGFGFGPQSLLSLNGLA